MRKNIYIRKLLTSVGLIVAVLVFSIIPVQVANAATLTAMSDTLTTLKISVVADHEIMFVTPTGLASGETIILTWDSDFSVSGTLDFEDIDLSFESTPDGVCETGDTQMELAATPSGTIMGADNTSGTVITFTNGSTTVAAGGEICIQIGQNATEVAAGDQQITNATSATSFDLVISGTIGAPDTGTIVITTITDDAVVTTATVVASLTFSISDVTIGFGTLSTSTSRWATGDTNGTGSATIAHTIAAGTNSTSGYTITVNGTTLTSGGNTIDAMSSEATLTTGQEEFGLRITSSGGSGAVDAIYDDSPSDSYALITASFPDTIASSSGASATTTYSLYYVANIGAATEAATDYSSTLTYIATGNF